MKIVAEHNIEGTYIILEEVYSGVTLRTKEGKTLNICMRDMGFDINIDEGEWHHVDDDNDFATLPEKSKR